MVTRLYPDGGTKPFWDDFAIDSAWNVSSGFRQRILRSTSVGGGGSDTVTVVKSSAGTINGCCYQLVYPNLAAQTISGNVKGQCGAAEPGSTSDTHPQVIIRVLSRNLATVRGTLLSPQAYAISAVANAQGYEFPFPSVANRRFPSGYTGSGDALTSVVCQDRDVLVIEVGYRALIPTATGSGTITIQNAQTADLAESDTSGVITGFNTWFEFSNTISVLTPTGDLFNSNQSNSYSPLTYESQEIGERAGQLWPRGAGNG